MFDTLKTDPIDASTKTIDVPKNIQVDPLPNATLNDDLFKAQAETQSEFKSIQTTNAQDIKNEKIDLLYKFRKLESQGVRTTMNYNMNSHLDDTK